MIKRVIIFAAVLAAFSSPGTAANAAVIFDGSFGTAGVDIAPVGSTAGNQERSQSFTTGGGATTLQATFEVSRVGAVPDLMEMRVFSALMSGFPDVPVPGWSTATFDGSATSTGGVFDTELMVITGPALPAGTRHFLVWSRQGAISVNRLNLHLGNLATDGDLEPSEEAYALTGAGWILASFSDHHLIIDDAGLAAPNVITVPTDLDTLTALPFDVSGTCDAGTQNQLEVEITEVGAPLNTVDRQFVTCEVSDIWDVGTMGAAAWNADFTVTLFDIVEGTFGTRVLPALDVITVTVDVAGNPALPPPVIDPAATDDDFGFLGNLIRDALIFLFIPSTDALERFSNLFVLIGSKPPIGFITAAVAAFDDLEEGTPVEVLEGTATLSAYFDPIKTSISAFLFLLFGLYLINRLSRINI